MEKKRQRKNCGAQDNERGYHLAKARICENVEVMGDEINTGCNSTVKAVDSDVIPILLKTIHNNQPLKRGSFNS